MAEKTLKLSKIKIRTPDGEDTYNLAIDITQVYDGEVQLDIADNEVSLTTIDENSGQS